MRRTTLALLATLALAASAVAADDGHHPGHHAQHGAAPSAKPAPDERQAIKLADHERTAVLTEMRGFLESVHGIVAGLAAGKPAVAAAAAKSSGMGAMRSMPTTLPAKLPMEFKKLGMDTHQRFDALALEGQGMADPAVILKQLDGILANCNGCHAGFRFLAEQ